MQNWKELLEASKEALAMLKIYYHPNSDGSTPTIDRLQKAINDIEENVICPNCHQPTFFRNAPYSRSCSTCGAHGEDIKSA